MSQPASSGRGQKKSRKHHRPNHAIDTFPDKYALSTPFMDTSSSSTSRIATTDTWDIIRNNHPSPSKRARTDNWPPTSLPPTSLPPHPPSTSTVEQANLEDDESEIIAARPKPQGATAHMKQFLDKKDSLLDHILAHETHCMIGSRCACGVRDRTTMCHDCLQFEPLCDDCFVQCHRNQSLHWAERWNGSFFERKDLSQLGHVINLGHGGKPCPYSEDPKRLIVTDCNGIHDTKVAFCGCIRSGKEYTQLMKARLFPGSIDQPKMCFTFAVLKSFHMHCQVSKKSAYDFITALRRLTNNAFRDDVLYTYPQFLRAMRVWRLLTMLKRSGQLHGIDAHFPSRPKGSVVVPCLSCPEPGFNMAEDSDESAADMRHLYQLFLSVDGHFGLRLKDNKKDDPDDVSLLCGRGFFPQDQPFYDYLKTVGKSKEKSTCAKLNATNLQNKLKFKGCKISGIVSANCGRQSLFRFGSVADLQKGEQYAHTDWAVANSLRAALPLKYIIITYDINCQYSINIEARFKKHFPDVAHLLGKVIFLIPKLHLRGHKDDCQYKHSLDYEKCCGRTAGELIEGTWSEQKQAGGSTQEMNHGHRQDALSDHMNDYNWVKTEKMAHSLSTHLAKARLTLNEKKELFVGHSRRHGKARYEEWMGMSTSPRREKGEWQSVYKYNRRKVPSQARVYQELLSNEEKRDERRTRSAALSGMPSAVFLNQALRLQSTQRSIKAMVAREKAEALTHLSADIQKARQRLRLDLKKWRSEQQLVMPLVMDVVADLPFHAHPEHDKLCLPSDFTSDEQSRYLLEDIVMQELALREGEAHDALESLRQATKYLTSLRGDKAKHAKGQTMNLRAGSQVREAEAKQRKHMEKYSEARRRMLKLGKTEDGLKESFPVLLPTDVYMKDATDKKKVGDGRITEGWIWRLGYLGDMSDEERSAFDREVDRVQWFRARADMERWQEEVEILEEELRRMVRGCQRMDEVWTVMANQCEKTGYKAYALQKASMFKRMGDEANNKLRDAGGKWPPPGVTVAQHALSLRAPLAFEWPSESL